jgi:protein arginine kinase activator
MECQICRKNDATIHLKQELNGQTKELYVCEECASEHGFNVQSPMSLTDFLFGLGEAQEKAPDGKDKTCAVCHMRRSDFKKTSLLGCQDCYESFAEELEPLLAAMHRRPLHVGKVPASDRLAAETAELQRKLEAAVGAQNFEEAARLRDAMRDLRAGAEEDKPAPSGGSSRGG